MTYIYLEHAQHGHGGQRVRHLVQLVLRHDQLLQHLEATHFRRKRADTISIESQFPKAF